MTLEDANAEAQYLASTLGNQTIPKEDAISIGVASIITTTFPMRVRIQ